LGCEAASIYPSIRISADAIGSLQLLSRPSCSRYSDVSGKVFLPLRDSDTLFGLDTNIDWAPKTLMRGLKKKQVSSLDIIVHIIYLPSKSRQG
jgi:hypothetical protein